MIQTNGLQNKPPFATGNRHQVFFGSILAKVMRMVMKSELQLAPTHLSTIVPPRSGHSYVLYTHVPFCESLCPYCSFNRYVFQENRARKYFENLRSELRMVAEQGYTFQSMYIGGGTPTILVDELVKTIDLAKELFGVRDVSAETNPNHLIPEILEPLVGRVDRLSLGVQSFDDGLLRQMRRYDKYGSGDQIVERIQKAVGILPSLNVDMIFNFPSQTEAMLRNDIHRVIETGADQTTFYPLMSSPSVEQALERSVGHVDPSREAAYYQIINEELAGVYHPRSAWTYSRKQDVLIDEYIIETEEYVGVGSGSFSYLDGTLYVNTFSLSEYNRLVESGKPSVIASRKFNRLARMQYRFMIELFDLALNKKRFKNDFRVPIELGLWKELVFMAAAGVFQPGWWKNPILELNPRSKYLLVVLMREFFNGVNTLRDQARAALPDWEKEVLMGGQPCGTTPVRGTAHQPVRYK